MPIPALGDYASRRMAGDMPLVSIVTTVRNGAKTLPRTIASIREQAMPALDYVVVDAVSTDGTLDLIRANANLVTHWISEPDKGISDGFNKGIALSRGKYVQLLNADDWLSPGQLAAAVETLERTGADYVFGDLMYHFGDGRTAHLIRGEAEYSGRIAHIMPGLNHPTVMVRRSAYEQHGLFDIGLRLAMDYDLLLRFHRAGLRGVYDPRIVGHMMLDGASDRHTGATLREVRQVSIRHGYPAALAWTRYLLRLVKWRGRIAAQFLPRPLFDMLRRRFNRNYVPD